MAKLKMDYYINISPRAGSKYFVKSNPVISAGFRNGTFYVDGDVSKVISQTDITKVYIIKDEKYQPVSCDTFISLFRKWK